MGKLRVEEFDHAYLIHGTTNIAAARKALWKHLGKKKWTRVARMPARPLWTGEFGDKKPHKAVALYFSIAPGAERIYKP